MKTLERAQPITGDPPQHNALTLLSGLVVALLVTLRGPILALDVHAISVFAVFLGAAAVVTLTRISRLGIWSAAVAYSLVFCLFHLGLTALEALGQTPPDYLAGYVATWFNDYGTAREAIYLSVVAIWTFTLAVALAPRRSPVVPVADNPASRSAARLGALLVVVGTSTLLAYVALTVPDLLLGGGGREAYWELIEGSTSALIATPLITYGALLLALGSPGRFRGLGLAFLAMFGVWALAVGARTAVMYTALTMLVVAARRRRMPPATVAVLVFGIGLIIVGFVGQARLSGGYADRASLDPRAGIAEMGGSLRPVVEVVEYRRVNNEPLLLGATYVSFVTRGVEAVLGLPRPDGLTDPRIAGNEFRGRLDGFQIGYSAVAEAFRNGDLPGVILAFAVFGTIIGRLDGRGSPSPYGDFLVGVVFFVLAYHVRQPSVSLLANLATAGIVALCWRATTALRVRESQRLSRLQADRSTRGRLPIADEVGTP